MYTYVIKSQREKFKKHDITPLRTLPPPQGRIQTQTPALHNVRPACRGLCRTIQLRLGRYTPVQGEGKHDGQLHVEPCSGCRETDMEHVSPKAVWCSVVWCVHTERTPGVEEEMDLLALSAGESSGERVTHVEATGKKMRVNA